jgi:hypothetical protein
MSPFRLLPKTDPATPFWKRPDVRIGLIAGVFGLTGAIVTATSTLLKKESQATSPSPTTVNNSSPVTVNNSNSTPVTVNNNNNIVLPPKADTPTTEGKSLGLQQFTLNTTDSFFEQCEGGARACTLGHWTTPLTHWEPSEKYWRFADGDRERTKADVQKYNADREFYDAHLQPVFDVVISNPNSQPVVLTAIDLVAFRETEWAAGDGEATPSGGVIKVMNRYTLSVDGSDYDKKFPVVRSKPATPPLEIAAGRPGRFQVALDTKVGSMMIFEMQLRFHFGSSGVVKTNRFRVSF